MSRNLAKIVLVEDSVALREGVRNMLSEIPGLIVHGEFEAAQDAIRGIDRIRPDIVILDIGLKSGNGLEVLHHLNQVHPRCTAIVFSNRVDTEYRKQAMHRGATHVFNKFSESEQLFDAVAKLVAGRSRAEESGLADDVRVQECLSWVSSTVSFGEKQCG